MLDQKIFNRFISETNKAYSQFSVWMHTNNEFVKHQTTWNDIPEPRKLFKLEDFSRDKGCKYKNFWDITLPSLQQSWILSIARLFDPPYFSRDIGKRNPRLSLYYILELIEDDELERFIKNEVNKHEKCIQSIREQRNNVYAHKAVYFDKRKIEAGIEDLFNTFDRVIIKIKKIKPHLKYCQNINSEYIERLSECGVQEIFEKLI